MTLVRSNPAGWALNDDLTSGQANSMDAQIASALDRTPAGDVLEGIITMVPGAAVKASIPGGVQSTVPGGIALNGGATDYPTFGVNGSAPRAKSRWWPIQLLNSLAPGWGVFNNPAPPAPLPGLPFNQLIGPGGGSKGSSQIILLPPMHQGATLSTVTIAFSLGTFVTPPAGQPGTQLALDVLRFGPMTTLALPAPVVSLSSTTPTAQSPASISLLGGVNQNFTYNATVNNVIDQTQYQYVAILTDAYGVNVGANTSLYLGMQLGYTAITDMRFA